MNLVTVTDLQLFFLIEVFNLGKNNREIDGELKEKGQILRCTNTNYKFLLRSTILDQAVLD